MKTATPRLVDPPGTPHVLRLRREANQIAMLYGGCPVYLVGGALTDSNPRDLDVVVILPDELFVATYGDDEDSRVPPKMRREAWFRGRVCQFSCDGFAVEPGPLWRRWARDMAKWNARLTRSIHRRVDFKTQPATLAEIHHAGRPRARLDTMP